MLETSNPDPLRHFGLHILEFIVKNQWNKMEKDHKENFLSTLFSYCADGVKDIKDEKRFIKEKVAELIVSVMKREWPQK